MDVPVLAPPAVPSEALWMMVLPLVIASAGFYRMVYFVSVGYAFSIAAMSVCAAWLFRDHLDLWSAATCLVLGIYGLRLGTFLVTREFKPSYRRELKDMQQRAREISLGRRFLIWIGVSLLYVLMFSPCLFTLSHLRVVGAGTVLPSLWGGLGIMVAGLALEVLADRQKSVFKLSAPSRFCDVGLYQLVRCPNYLGEILFWVGVWVSGVSAYTHWVHWGASGVGLLCIVLIMIGSTKRLEAKQQERYGDDVEFQKYSQSVPVLVPFVPLYTLKNVRVYIE